MSSFKTVWKLTAAGLSGIFTRFPFHRFSQIRKNETKNRHKGITFYESIKKFSLPPLFIETQAVIPKKERIVSEPDKNIDFSLYLCRRIQRGACLFMPFKPVRQAEIIPIEPDTDNAAEGKCVARRIISTSLLLYSFQLFLPAGCFLSSSPPAVMFYSYLKAKR